MQRDYFSFKTLKCWIKYKSILKSIPGLDYKLRKRMRGQKWQDGDSVGIYGAGIFPEDT